MRIITGLIIIMVSLGDAAVAQIPMPEIPDRTKCDSMASRSGNLTERYGSRELYLGCFVAESVPTLLLESQAQTDAAQKSFSKSTEKIPVKDAVTALKNAEAQANTGLYAARYAREYLKANTFEYPDSRKSQLELAEVQTKIGNLINKMIKHQYAKLKESHPDVELARLKSRLVTLKYCEMYKNRYETGKMTEVERSFLFPQSYQDKVFTCAGVGVNFYDLLLSSRRRIRAEHGLYAPLLCAAIPDSCKDVPPKE